MNRAERIKFIEQGIPESDKPAPVAKKKKRKPGLLDRARGLLGKRKTYVNPNLRGKNREFMEKMAREPK